MFSELIPVELTNETLQASHLKTFLVPLQWRISLWNRSSAQHYRSEKVYSVSFCPNPTYSESLQSKKGRKKKKSPVPTFLRVIAEASSWGCQLLKSPPKVLSFWPYLGINPACWGQIITPCIHPIKSLSFCVWEALLQPGSVGMENSPRSCFAKINLLYFFNLA